MKYTALLVLIPPGLIRNFIHIDWFDRNDLIWRLEGMYDLDLFEIEQIIEKQ